MEIENLDNSSAVVSTKKKSKKKNNNSSHNNKNKILSKNVVMESVTCSKNKDGDTPTSAVNTKNVKLTNNNNYNSSNNSNKNDTNSNNGDLNDLNKKLHERLHIKKNGLTNGDHHHHHHNSTDDDGDDNNGEDDESGALQNIVDDLKKSKIHDNQQNALVNNYNSNCKNSIVLNGCETCSGNDMIVSLSSSQAPSSGTATITSTIMTTTTITTPSISGTAITPNAAALTTTVTDDPQQTEGILRKISYSTLSTPIVIEYKEYESELQMPDIIRLIQKDLSEPYSIYTYRYFIHNWPKLCFLAMHNNVCVGAIVCKLDMHYHNVKRGYIAMLAVDKDYRKLKIGTNLVHKAIQAMLNDNADEVVLETEITNIPALKLYENLGFVRDKRLFHYYLNGVDALRLKLWFR